MSTESGNDKMREEYNFPLGARGKYAKAYNQESNVVVLTPDVAQRFPNSESVNQALRRVANLMDAK